MPGWSQGGQSPPPAPPVATPLELSFIRWREIVFEIAQFTMCDVRFKLIDINPLQLPEVDFLNFIGWSVKVDLAFNKSMVREEVGNFRSMKGDSV